MYIVYVPCTRSPVKTEKLRVVRSSDFRGVYVLFTLDIRVEVQAVD